MIDVLTSPPNMADLLAGYDILPESTATHIRFARTADPQPFICHVCGAEFRSVWVGIHVIRGRCNDCNEAMRKTAVSTPDGYPMPPMYTRDGSALLPSVRAWMHRPLPAMALLHGGPGRGKSAQAHHIAARCHETNTRCQIIGDRDLIRMDDDALRSVASVSMLVIDEIGRRSSESVIANLCEIIDRRIPYDRKTAIISNLTGEDLAMIDARLISRIKAAERIAFTGPDLRKPVMA